MFIHLLSLEWKAFFRSDNMGRGLGVKILLGFFAIYFGVIFLAVGFGLYPILEEQFPDVAPMQMVNRYLLLWFVTELTFRSVLQQLPVMNVRPLITQNIRRSTIVHYLLTKTIFSFYNLLAPFVFVPFFLICLIKTDYSPLQLLAWLIACISMVLTINFLNFLFQKSFAENLKALAVFLALGLILFLLDYFSIFSITALFGKWMDSVLLYPYLCLIPIGLMYLVYRINFRMLLKNFYFDGYLKGKSTTYRDTDLSWTQRFGAMAPFLQLDIRLLQRNKRAKSTVILSMFFLLYGLLFYTNPTYTNSSFLIFVGIFITGMFTINFGQFIPAWDSSYFSMMMSQNIPLRLYLESKATLMYISIVILALLSIPYAYFGWEIVLLNLACAIYNIGINVPMILYFGSFNRKRIDLEKTQFLNYQGTGAAQWIVGLPLFLIPVITWLIISKTADRYTATAVLAVLGMIGLLLKNVLMPRIVQAYRKRKYKMINGFKQQQS